MYKSGFHSMGFMKVLMPFHMVFNLFILIGLALLFVWAYRSLNGKALKDFAVHILIVGIVGSLLTAVAVSWKMKTFHTVRSAHTAVFETMLNHLDAREYGDLKVLIEEQQQKFQGKKGIWGTKKRG